MQQLLNGNTCGHGPIKSEPVDELIELELDRRKSLHYELHMVQERTISVVSSLQNYYIWQCTNVPSALCYFNAFNNELDSPSLVCKPVVYQRHHYIIVIKHQQIIVNIMCKLFR